MKPTLAADQSVESDYGPKVSVKKRGTLRRLIAFVGPAYLVSVGYMDPGNWATDIEGGVRFGYMLIWVLLVSNIMAVVLQTLCARLGIVTGLDLAQGCRREYSRPINFFLWILAEIAIAATDLAEVLGTIVGLNLLFGLPLLWGCAVTALNTFLLLHGHPAEGIVKAVDTAGFDMLIMGSHGHRGLDDLVFGQTVSAVRHAIDIPVLVVRSYGRELAQRSRYE